MKYHSFEQLEEIVTELTKRVASLETSEDARQYRESLLYPAFKTLAKRRGDEDCYSKAVVGPENRPIALPALLDDEDAGGVYKAAYELLTDEERREMDYIRARQLAILQKVAAKRMKRADKSKGVQGPKKSDGEGDIA